MDEYTTFIHHQQEQQNKDCQQHQLDMLAIIEESEFDNSNMFNDDLLRYNGSSSVTNSNNVPYKLNNRSNVDQPQTDNSEYRLYNKPVTPRDSITPQTSYYNNRYSTLEESTYNSFLSLFDEQHSPSNNNNGNNIQKDLYYDNSINQTDMSFNSRYSTSSSSTAVNTNDNRRISNMTYQTSSSLATTIDSNRFSTQSNVVYDKKKSNQKSSHKFGSKKEKVDDTRSKINLDFYDLTSEDYNGVPFNFSLLFDKVVMVVNVASFCHFTKQYEQLEDLYERYNSKGFEIIAFPSNQFLQEPKSETEIVEYCSRNFNVSFPVMRKIKVNGKESSPIYDYLKTQKKGIWNQRRVLWNFEKFLIDKKGNVVERAWSFTNPKDFENLIVKLLDE